MSVNPINPDGTDTADPFAEAPDESQEAAAVDFVPQRGDVVRLDEPAAGGEPCYALFIDENTVVPLSNVQRYELPLYPAS